MRPQDKPDCRDACRDEEPEIATGDGRQFAPPDHAAQDDRRANDTGEHDRGAEQVCQTCRQPPEISKGGRERPGGVSLLDGTGDDPERGTGAREGIDNVRREQECGEDDGGANESRVVDH